MNRLFQLCKMKMLVDVTEERNWKSSCNVCKATLTHIIAVQVRFWTRQSLGHRNTSKSDTRPLCLKEWRKLFHVSHLLELEDFQPFISCEVQRFKEDYFPSFLPSISFPDFPCDLTDLIWRKGTPFEAMTGRTASSSHGLLAEVFGGFPQP